ncbi:hypothetical protein POM88_021722 [Heracleum sosnowskyi]|uniref:Uncharacterized protein n=1 Tax=Heracleum sosnowskyi TaxID=360622 RepID=A0AAD8MT22_9APIA|nr:hypothetical protein POM88_021722 [Heracleum sosnowskyi]
MKSVEEKERDEAHLHVLQNNSEVHPYIMMHKELLERQYQGKKKSAQWLIGEHNRLFANWFEKMVSVEMMENAKNVSETIRWLASKPSFSVLTYEGDTTLENPSFCSNIPICDKVDDSECIIASKRQNVEGIWIKN